MQDAGLKAKEAHQLSIDDLTKIRGQLDERSHAHCLAKWFQVTLNLHNGRSASCCLQPSKVLPLNDIKKKPSLLHNGEHHVRERRELREGKKISECNVCWEVEKKGNFSERHFKSADAWAWDKLAIADEAPDNINPTYIEVSFSNQCQLRCSYCNPETSSAIANEINQHGAYPDRFTEMSYDERLKRNAMPWSELHQEANPYVESFWAWLPEVYNGLKVFRVTGGEPFLSEDTFKFIDYVAKFPNPQMAIEFNSNLSFPSTVLKRFEKAFGDIPRANYKNATLYVSLDCWGERAEYIRFGMRISEIEKNIEYLLTKFPQMRLVITSTISILGAETFGGLIEKVEALKMKWGRDRVTLTAYPLVFPQFQALNLAPVQTRSLLKALEAQVLSNSVFSLREKEMISSIRARSEMEITEELRRVLTADFYRFFSEYDRRKKLSLIETFPEYKDLYSEGQSNANQELDQWILDTHSNESIKAIVACNHILRVGKNDLNGQMALVNRLVTRDDLTLKTLLKIPRLHLLVLDKLAKGLVRADRAVDILSFLSLRDPENRELEQVVVKTLGGERESLLKAFHVWNGCVDGVGILAARWGNILQGLFSTFYKNQDDEGCEALVISCLKLSVDFSRKMSLQDVKPLHKKIIHREDNIDEKELVSIFTSKTLIIANSLADYFISIKANRRIALILIKLAHQYQQVSGQVATALSVWRSRLPNTIEYLFEGNAFSNGLIARSLGLDLELISHLSEIDNDSIISTTISEWSESGVHFNPDILATIICDKTACGHVPYEWLEIAVKASDEEDLAEAILVYTTKNFHTYNKKQKEDCFNLIKSLPRIRKTTIQKDFLLLVNSKDVHLFIDYAIQLEQEYLLAQVLEALVISSDQSDEELALIWFAINNKLIKSNLICFFKKLLLDDKRDHWNLFETIIKTHDNKEIIDSFTEVIGSHKDVYKLKCLEKYFEHFVSKEKKSLLHEGFSSSHGPAWWASVLSKHDLLSFDVWWLSITNAASEEDYWSLRNLDCTTKIDFDKYPLSPIVIFPSSDECRLDLARYLISNFKYNQTIVDLFYQLVSPMGIRYIWTLLGDIDIKTDPFLFQSLAVALIRSNLKDEAVYAEILTRVKEVSLDPCFDLKFDPSWIRNDFVLSLATLWFSPNELIELLPSINKRGWVLDLYVLSRNFKSSVWTSFELYRLYKMDQLLTLNFWKETKDTIPSMTWYKTAIHTGAASNLGAYILSTDDFLKSFHEIENLEDQFYSLQMRMNGPHASSWTVSQIVELEEDLQIELWRLAHEVIGENIWMGVASINGAMSQISAYLLNTKDYLSKLHEIEKLEDQFYSLQMRMNGPHASSWTASQIVELEEDLQIELWRLGQVILEEEVWMAVASTNGAMSQISAYLLNTKDYLSKLHEIENLEDKFYSLQMRMNGPHASSWTASQIVELEEDLQIELWCLGQDKIKSEEWKETAVLMGGMSELGARILPVKEFSNSLNREVLKAGHFIKVHVENFNIENLSTEILSLFDAQGSEFIFSYIEHLLDKRESLNKLTELYDDCSSRLADIIEQNILAKKLVTNEFFKKMLVRYSSNVDDDRLYQRIKDAPKPEELRGMLTDEDVKVFSVANDTSRVIKVLTELNEIPIAIEIANESMVSLELDLDQRLKPWTCLAECGLLENEIYYKILLHSMNLLKKGDPACYPIVDLCVKNNVNRALGMKIFILSPLKVRAQTERPFLKLLYYLKGIINQVDQM